MNPWMIEHPNHGFRLAWLRAEAVRHRRSTNDLALANMCERVADIMADGFDYETALAFNRGFQR